MTLDITILISVIGLALSVGTFFVGRTTAAKSAGKQDGAVLTKLDSIGEKIGKLETTMNTINVQLGEQRDRITRIETRMDIYHKGGEQK